MTANNYNKGTFNELCLALHLSLSNTFPTSYKDDPPSIRFEQLKAELGEDISNVIFLQTSKTAFDIKANFINDKLLANTTDIAEIAWTNSPNKDSDNRASDHQKFTGVNDPNSDADLIVKTFSNTYIGISAKYGQTKDGTLRSPSLLAIGNILKIDNITRPLEEHDLFVETLGFVGSKDVRKDQYKNCKGSSEAIAAEVSILKVKRQIVAEVHNKLGTKTSEELKTFVVDLISPSTIFPHYRVQTITRNDDFENKIYNVRAETSMKLDRYTKLYTTESTSETTYSTIYGLTKTKQQESVIKFSVKNKNSPMKGLDGHVTSPMLNRVKKYTLYAFDLDYTLFHYTDDGALIHILDEDGNIKYRLSQEEANEFVTKTGHSYSYTEFENARLFHDTALPIQNMIDKMMDLHRKGKDVRIVTARRMLDDMSIVAKTLEKYGIDSENIPMNMTGSIPNITTTGHGKYVLFSELLKEYKYDEIVFYDDSENNLRTFMKLNEEFPHISLKPYLVKFRKDKQDATIKKFKG